MPRRLHFNLITALSIGCVTGMFFHLGGGGPEFFHAYEAKGGGTNFFSGCKGGDLNFFTYAKRGGPEKIVELRSQTDSQPSR